MKGSNNGVLDIHKYIYMDTGKEEKLNKNLWLRSKTLTFLDIKTAVPSNEDILFILLINLARNLRNATSFSNILYSFFDFKYIVQSKPDFNWEILKENAKITRTQDQMYFSLYFIKVFLSDIIPNDILNIDNKCKKQLNDYCLKIYFNRIFLENLRQKNKNLTINDILKNTTLIKDYLKIKPKYFIMKRLRRFPFIISKIMERKIK